MAFSGLILTTNGKVLCAKNDQGKPLNFTRIAIGDGLLGGGDSLVNRNALLNERMSLGIDGIQAVDEGVSTALLATLSNGELTEGFYFRELGIFAEDPDTHGELLCYYDNAGTDGEYIPDKDSAVLVSERIRLIIARDSAKKLTINNTGNPLYVTWGDLRELLIEDIDCGFFGDEDEGLQIDCGFFGT